MAKLFIRVVIMRNNKHILSKIDKEGLLHEIIIILNKYYMLTTHIDVSDGEANGAGR